MAAEAPGTQAPAPAPDPQRPGDPSQLRLAMYWDAVDLRRPDHALFRELLDAFGVQGIARAVAWEIWSTADRRTGRAPDWVTAAWCGERLGRHVKRSIHPALRLLDARSIVLTVQPRAHQHPRLYEVNIAALYRRRRRSAPAQADLLAPAQADLLAPASPADAPPAPADAPTTEPQRVGIASMAAELGVEVDVPADRVAASAVYAELKRQVEIVRAAHRAPDPERARRILEAQRSRR